MRPVFIPLAQRLGHLALRGRGVSSRWVATPHGRLHVYDARGRGAGPTTVLLHGIGSAATPFGPVLVRLQRSVKRVVAIEYPGHGFSDVAAGVLTPERLLESVTAGLDALLDEPSVLVGNSLGGALAIHYALARPQRVGGLMLVSPAGARASDDELQELKRGFDLSTRADAAAFLARIYHKAPWFIPLLAHEFPAAMLRPAVRDLLGAASNDHAPEPDALASLAMPILLLWGKSERLLPETHFDYFARHLPPHAVLERPEGFGHCPHFDAPGRFARRIAQFAEHVRAAQHAR